MVKHEIHSSAELKRRLEDVGVVMSSAQVTRVVNEMPSRISTGLLLGLVKIFKCTTNDLISVEHTEEDDNEERTNVRHLHEKKVPVQSSGKMSTIQRKKREPKPVEDFSAITGGPARTFPVKGRDDS